MTRSAWENSAIAICSRELKVVAKLSKYMESAASTAPPPGTTDPDSSTRLTTHMASWRARSISSSVYSLAPRSRIEHDLCDAHPSITSISLSPTRSSYTLSAAPSSEASNDSSPSMPASDSWMVAPVTLAMRRMSSFLTRRQAMAPASTKYLRHMSSMPFEVRITLAPAFIIISIRSFMMSSSLSLIACSLVGSVTTTCTPIDILNLRRS
mmetsp:Transcript_7329/g.14227  ORF Transcript_7329/g.14227 Transcript_7329/m.14227 type:complete len:210 (-) Transcript_7329:817-1446(-)